MKYVSVVGDERGNVISADRYLARLPGLAESLPEGARAFAVDPDHYDFWGKRCIKDLELDRLERGTENGTDWLELGFRHNCWKHDEDLTIRYHGFENLWLTGRDGASDPDHRDLGTVILDEILPDAAGCRHEIAGRVRTMVIVSRDLTAGWRAAQCPDLRSAAERD